MKISVIKEYNLDYLDDQIVCLTNFDKKDLIGLKKSFLDVCRSKTIILSEQHFIEGSDCKLILDLSIENRGLIELAMNVYNCLLTKNEYIEIVKRIDLFVENGYDQKTYLWLYDINNPIDFLLSKSGSW